MIWSLENVPRQQFISGFTPTDSQTSERAGELPRRLHIDLCGMHVSPSPSLSSGYENFSTTEYRNYVTCPSCLRDELS